MTALNFFKSLGGGFSFLAERAAFDFLVRSALSSLFLLSSAVFLFLCASRINGECAFAPAENIHAAPNARIIEDTKKIALDGVLYGDFVKSRAADGGGELFAPFFASENFAANQSGGKLPVYAPTVIVKALALLDEESVCVLDIDGEEPGKIFKAGDVFGDGLGRVVKISESGVAWQWLDREYVAGF